MTTLASYNRQAEYEAYDALPLPVRQALQHAHAEWSAKRIADRWRDEVSRNVARIIQDVQRADKARCALDRVIYSNLARGVGWKTRR